MSPARLLPLRASLPALGLLVLLLASSPSLAQFSNYHLVAVEHDDQGRSDEPDFASTAVLGPTLTNCILSFDPFRTPGVGRACVADSALPPPSGSARAVAPGCTDDSGRRPSGLCGLWSVGVKAHDNTGAARVLVPPGTAGVAGMSGNAAPGAYTPTKGSVVRLLDLQLTAALPAASYAELNRKTGDAGARGLAATLGLGDGGVLAGPAAAWAWYGVWQDKNGNGVIDHLGDNAGHADASNEFRWVGACGDVVAELCLPEPGLHLPLWVWPGNHHQQCGFLIGCYAPADAPGRQALCFALLAAANDAELLRCLPAGDFDREERWADPLLGPTQPRASVDGELEDDTLVLQAEKRLWHGGLNPAYYYDQSLLTTTTLIAGTTLLGPDEGLAAGFDLAALQFVDVDRIAAWLPTLGDLLHQQLRPSARSPWVAVRDAYAPVATLLDGQAHGHAVDAPSQRAGAVDDAVRDPGWSREPNTAMDRFPGATHGAFAPSPELPAGEQRHRGWLNGDAGYRAGWHAWADVKAERVDYTYGKWDPAGVFGIGGGFWDSWSALPRAGSALPRGPGDHTRSLDPGVFQWRGYAGAWHDQPTVMVEEVLDLAETAERLAPTVVRDTYVLPPDGWVGNIVNTTGAFRYRGYGEEECTIQGVRAPRAWAVCHPYLDAAAAGADPEGGIDQTFGVDLSDPQDYGPVNPEFEVLSAAPPPGVVLLRPAGGAWTVPVFVWRDMYHWRPGDVAAFEDLTGTSQPIALRTLDELAPALRSRVVTRDLLVLPQGNRDLAITSEFAVRVQVAVPTRGIAVDEVVVDVDAYRGWSAGA